MRESKSKPESAEEAESAEGAAPRALGLNRLTELIIGAAIEVHRATGPGSMESVYEQCLCYEFSQRGLRFQRQVELPVEYKGIKLDCGFRMDVIVENEIVPEVKTVDHLLPIHSAQLLTYLKLSGKRIGLLINFNEQVLKKGLKRLANHAPDGAAARPSVPPALSRFDFLSSLRLSVSAVKKRQANQTLDAAVAHPSAPSAPSALSGFDFRNSLRLSASAVNNLPGEYLRCSSAS